MQKLCFTVKTAHIRKKLEVISCPLQKGCLQSFNFKLQNNISSCNHRGIKLLADGHLACLSMVFFQISLENIFLVLLCVNMTTGRGTEFLFLWSYSV